MDESDPLSFRSDPRLFIDQANTRIPAPLENSVEIRNRKADVMNARAALRDEFSNRRIGAFRLQKLHERLAGLERFDPRTVGISELHRLHSQYCPVKRHCRFERGQRNPDVRDSDPDGG